MSPAYPCSRSVAGGRPGGRRSVAAPDNRWLAGARSSLRTSGRECDADESEGGRWVPSSARERARFPRTTTVLACRPWSGTFLKRKVKRGGYMPTYLQCRTFLDFTLEPKSLVRSPKGVSNTEERSPSYLNVLQREVSRPRYATFFIVERRRCPII